MFKYGPEITPYLDSFHAVLLLMLVIWGLVIFAASVISTRTNGFYILGWFLHLSMISSVVVLYVSGFKEFSK